MEPYRFGLSVIPERNPDQVVDLCTVAERLGFDYIWMADEGPEFYDPFVMLSLVASKTNRIKLGTGITNPYMRHPALIASAILSLHAISQGRAVLGIGAGGSLALPKLGLPMWNKPVENLTAAITAIREIFETKVVNASSNVWKIVDLKWAGPAAQIPIYLGAKGPRMIETASQMADGLILSTLPLKELTRLITLVKPRVGNPFDLAYISRVCIADGDVARKLVKPYLTFSIADCPKEVLKELDITEETQEEMRRMLASKGPDSAAGLVPDEVVDSMAVAGNADKCLEAVKERFAAGVNHFIVSPPYGPDPEKALLTFAREVIDPLKCR